MALSTGQMVNNRYRIVKLLGQGGYGAVYRAWDTSLSAPCVVKENFEISIKKPGRGHSRDLPGDESRF